MPDWLTCQEIRGIHKRPKSRSRPQTWRCPMRMAPVFALALASIASHASASPSHPVLFPNPVLFQANIDAAAVGDLNQDQVPDLVLARGSATTVYLGEGNGLFTPGSSMTTPT